MGERLVVSQTFQTRHQSQRRNPHPEASNLPIHPLYCTGFHLSPTTVTMIYANSHARHNTTNNTAHGISLADYAMRNHQARVRSLIFAAHSFSRSLSYHVGTYMVYNALQKSFREKNYIRGYCHCVKHKVVCILISDKN